MAILQVNDISKSFAGEYILNNISFSLEEGDKVGLIGLNGCGKTTLFKMILGREDIDINEDTKKYGDINKKKGLRIGYLSQNLDIKDENRNPKNEPIRSHVDACTNYFGQTFDGDLRDVKLKWTEKSYE